MKKLQREDKDGSDEEDDEDKEEDDDDEEEESGGESKEEEAADEEEEQPVRMSLMVLLAETDEQMGLDGYMMDDDDHDYDDDEDGSCGRGEYNNCCVCMVRHKATAFVPCGHSFCRLCSKELWVQKENCPLCNNYILEILDIF